MSYHEPFENRTIAISISESPDMPALGLSKQHLQDAMAEIARHMLALGARLAYGGDLRPGGFSELLFELVARHRPDVDEQSGTGVYSYLAWPVHIGMEPQEVETAKVDLAGVAELICLDLDGAVIPMDVRATQGKHTATPVEWARGLTSMRRTMQQATDARVLLGGAVAGYRGAIPGIAEEADLTLQAKQPMYLLGGFGGCARDIAETIGIAPKWPGSRGNWPGRSTFQNVKHADFNNGLTPDELELLARTPHVDQAVILLMRGLRDVWM